MKSILREFKEFAVKGNMIDIAIGVIIGAAFNKVINVIVNEVFLPPLTMLTGASSWEGKKWVLRSATEKNGIKLEEVAVGYGNLIEAGIDFFIIALTVFLVIKLMNALRNKAEDPINEEVVTPKDIALLNKISDLMEEQLKELRQLRQDSSKS